MGGEKLARILAAVGVQLALAAAAGGAVWLAYTAARGGGALAPAVAAGVAAPALLAAMLVARRVDGGRAAQRGAKRGPGADRAIEELAERCLDLRSEEALAASIDEVVSQHLALGRAALYTSDGDGGVWRPVGAGAAAEVVVAPALIDVLVERREPIAAKELADDRFDDSRAQLAALLRELEAEILIPLVDRERVVGAVTAAGPAARSPRAIDRAALAQVQHAASRTLTYLALLREAERQVEVAREGEVAAAVQHGSAPGLREHVGQRLSVTSHYQPAAAFGGDFFSAAELGDGRTFVAIGDVSGRGMPAALISAAVAGACEAAERLLPEGASIVDIVDHFNRLVGAVARDRYAMSCFFALFEPDAASLTFADAGHPFPYVCRKRPDGGTELRALVARGVPLGLEPKPRVDVATFDLKRGDAIVLFTDAVVEALPPDEAAPYGDRRLRRLLRSRADSPRLCQAIVDDVLDYCGSRPLHDDITVAVVRIGASGPRSRRPSRS